MSWKVYEVVFRVCSPVHVGHTKTGNLQCTRPYVHGRALWGALVARLTRDKAAGAKGAPNSDEYRKMGDMVHRLLAFTYFFPALKTRSGYEVRWPWDDRNFSRRFLDSYAGTALSFSQQSAADGLLRETEFISPNTLDTGEQVFLKGYIFENDGCSLLWRDAIERLQIGGERSYGWGKLSLECFSEHDGKSLFGLGAEFLGKNSTPAIKMTSGPLLAHTHPEGVNAEGEIEPLMGREWDLLPGGTINFNAVCFVPGSRLKEPTQFKVGEFGVWKKI